MRKLHQMTLGVATLATFGLAISAPAEAKGIVKGAAKGAAVGHFVGHGHAKAGAMVGAVHGHHHAMKRLRASKFDFGAGGLAARIVMIRGTKCSNLKMPKN